jgi:phenylalanyl-tRNA synthetase beta chain
MGQSAYICHLFEGFARSFLVDQDPERDMRISLEWLAEYLPGPLDAQQLADSLTHGGLPVETIENRGQDTVLDVEVTSNRADCLSYIGVARELSALLHRPFSQPDAKPAESGVAASSAAAVAIEAADLCPHYVARIVRNVKIAPSPAWLTRRLEMMGSEKKPVRGINNVVDVTNYVLYETGQPLHAFDLDTLDGKQIIVRRARAGEKLVTLDGKERTLAPGMLVIADATSPVALAGVMGGLHSEVTAQTKNILLESARFDPLSIRRTARALAMGSDSSYRFERGIEPTLPGRAALRAADLFLQTAGGELLKDSIDAGSVVDRPRKLVLRLAQLKRILGVEFSADRVLDALQRLRLAPVQQGREIAVTVPSDRLDINIESDLVEEVARVIGYEHVPVRDEISIRLAPPDPAAHALAAIFAALSTGGYFEAVTFSFVSDLLAADFAPRSGAHPTDVLPRADAGVRKADASLRPSLLPGLLEAARRNQANGLSDPRFYEIGSVFWNNPQGAVVEKRKLGIVGSADLREVRGVVEAILAKLDIDRAVSVIPDAAAGYASSACGRIEWGGKAIGFIGKIDRQVSDKLSLKEPPAAAELDVPALLAGAQRVPQQRDLPRFPAVRRDLSLDLPEATRYEQIAGVVASVKPQWLETIEYVTTYRGKQLEAGQKSVTIALVFRSPTDTLTSEQVEASVQRVIEAAKVSLGAQLRT